eukprot:924679_1
MSSSAKRQVIQRLHDMGFSDSDIRSAITECGYNTEACADWIVNRKQDKKPRLFVGMEVWIFSPDDNDWCPGNIVSITKQLISIIFNGHDFRWLEKESDLYKIQDDKPIIISSIPKYNNYANGNGTGNGDTNITGDEIIDDPYSNNVTDEHQYTPPRQDETDYFVTFTESILGLELYSDEDGFNCIVGRCVSTIARQKVTPGSQIVQVNDRWLANYRFEEIRDAVKQAARQPPLAVTFRIKKNLLRRNKPPQTQAKNNEHTQQNINGNNNIQIPNSPYGYDASNTQSATSPETGNVDDSAKLAAPKSTAVQGGSIQNSFKDEEKRSQPQLENGTGDEVIDFMGTLEFNECNKLQIGDHVDHRDDVGRFLLATIVDKDEYKVKIHYEGWNSKWDTWCDYKLETHRFASPRSISRKPNTRFRDLKIRDYVDINPIQRHRGWRVGQIRRMDKYSGQAQIVYKEDGQEFLYWAHLNNPQEIAPFMTRAAETIALQQKLAEFEEEQQAAVQGNVNENEDINGVNNAVIADEPIPMQVNVIQPSHNQQPHVPFNNSSATDQQQQLLNSFMVPPQAATVTTQNTQATDKSVGYNSAMNMPTLPYNPQLLDNNVQPPPANNIAMDNPYNDNVNVNQNYQYNNSPPNDINRPLGARHQQSRSRVLPRTIKNKKLPPKPAKNMGKNRKKGINRSRTQPLPDNQNNPNNQSIPILNPINVNQQQNTTNFADLNFAPAQYQNHNNTQTNFMHGKTTYTAQW